MAMTATAPRLGVVAGVLLCILGACGTADDGRSDNGPDTAATDQDYPSGSTSQGKWSRRDVTEMQDDAESAAEQVTSGEGLRVENKTGESVELTLADGTTAWVKAGRYVVILKPCRDTLPLRAEWRAGGFTAEHDGPCLQRDTWVLR